MQKFSRMGNMSRTIRFRAWHNVRCQMYDVEAINWLEQDAVLFPITKGSARASKLNSLHDLELMQFTGLHDKNGKEIYEGDILNLIPDDYSQEPAQVCWDDNLARFIYRRISKLQIANGQVILTGWQPVEVIGNIYENPELLLEKS